jgi:hypothetical protein
VDLESFVENWSESPAAVIKHGPGVGKSSKDPLRMEVLMSKTPIYHAINLKWDIIQPYSTSNFH